MSRSRLGLWDAVSVIVGIVIGAGIYETAPLVFRNVASPVMGVGIWILGGGLSVIGALCYAELASTYPRSGGDYVYLSRAFGPAFGFLFGWAQLAVIMTGSIGMMAFVFADYARALWAIPEGLETSFAIGAILVLTLTNAFGILCGKRTQNTLTILNVAGLLMILTAGVLAVSGGSPNAFAESAGETPAGFSFPTLGLALIFVLYTYGGWNDAAYVAADVRHGKRNVPLALLIGTGVITLLYVLVNTAYLASLGFEGARESRAIASDVLAWPFGSRGSDLMAGFVMISALGAVNGLIFTGSRVYAALGSEHGIFGWLGRWDERKGVPLYSLLAQAGISILLVAMVGTQTGRAVVAGFGQTFGLSPPSWSGHGGFESLMRCTAPVFWFFFLLTGTSLFVLRRKDRDLPRPFAVPLFPFLPLIFCATSSFMLYQSIRYAGSLTWIGVLFLAAGIPFYLLSKDRRRLQVRYYTGLFAFAVILLPFAPAFEASAKSPVHPMVGPTSADTEEPELTVPYVPTPQNVVDKMLEMAKVTKNDVVYDLGCGDGRIVVTAAKQYGARGVGVDLDPMRVQESKENVSRNGVQRLVEIRQADVLETDVKPASVVTLYLLPEVNMDLRQTLRRDLAPGSRVVSHDFDMGDWQPKKTVEIKDQDGHSHTLYLWEIEATKKPVAE